MIIDETTGLPQLDEGLVWRVGDARTTGTGHCYRSNVLWVEICKVSTEIRVDLVKKPEERSLRNFWRPLRETTGHVDVEEQKLTPVQSLMLADYKTQDESAPWPEGWTFDCNVWSEDGTERQAQFFRPLPSTPESVLKIAIEVLDKYTVYREWKTKREAERETERVAREKISGVYPPKKLVV